MRQALLGGAVEVAGRLGRSLLMAVTRETVPAGEAFARRIGARLGQVMIENRLDLRAVDRDLVRSWVDAGPSRARGYHLEFVRGSTPDRLLPDVAAMLALVMNTAPRDDAARWLVTSNAASNDAMLSINRQLGFQAGAAVMTWQVSIERARAYLSG